MTTAILEGDKQCRGPCGRRLGPESFVRDRKSPDGRAATCRDCRKGRPPREQGIGLARRYEALRPGYLARLIPGREQEAAWGELAAWVRRHGEVRVGDVACGWDVLEGEMFRRVIRRK